MLNFPKIKKLLATLKKEEKWRSLNFFLKIAKILAIAGSTLFSFSTKAYAQKLKNRIILKTEKDLIGETIKKTDIVKTFKKGRKMRTEVQKELEKFLVNFIYNMKSNPSEELKKVGIEKEISLPKIRTIDMDDTFFQNLGVGLISTSKSIIQDVKIQEIEKIIEIRSFNYSTIILGTVILGSGALVIKKLLSLRGGKSTYSFSSSDSFKAASTKSKIVNFLKDAIISIPVVVLADWLLKKFRKTRKSFKEIPTIKPIDPYYESLLEKFEFQQEKLELQEEKLELQEDRIKKLELEQEEAKKKLREKFFQKISKRSRSYKKPRFDSSEYPNKDENQNENPDDEDNPNDNGNTYVKVPKNEEEDRINLAGF
jgi:hypothetical protein